MSDIIAFTGPARDLTREEIDVVRHEVILLSPFDTIFRSGCAYGVDTAAALAVWAGLVPLGAKLELHVPVGMPHNEGLVVDLASASTVVHHDALKIVPVEGGYMARNDSLVAGATRLVAFPETDDEVLRSGTWATVRRARKRDIRVDIRPLAV